MPWLGTFHSIGAKILRRHAELVGLRSDFTILDTDDQLRLMQAGHPGREHRREALAGPCARRLHRRLEEPRPDARQGARRRGRRLRQRPRREALCRLPGAPEARSTPPISATCCWRTCGSSASTPTCCSPTRSASSTSSSTNTRTPTSRNISGCACSRRAAETSAASATTTSRSMAGAARRSTTSCASSTTFPARPSSGSSATTAPPATSWPPPPHLIAHNEGRLGKTLYTEDEPGEKVDGHRRVGQRGGSPPHRRGDRGAAAEGRIRSDEMADARAHLLPDARVRRALHHARPALPGDRRPALLRARWRSATPSPICAASPTRPTTSPSSASSTRRSAASATRRSNCCTAMRAPARVPLMQAAPR